MAWQSRYIIVPPQLVTEFNTLQKIRTRKLRRKVQNALNRLQTKLERTKYNCEPVQCALCRRQVRSILFKKGSA